MRCNAWNCRLYCDGECIDSCYVEIDENGCCTMYEEWGTSHDKGGDTDKNDPI